MSTIYVPVFVILFWSSLCTSEKSMLFNIVLGNAKYTEEPLFTSLQKESNYLYDSKFFTTKPYQNGHLLKQASNLRSKRKGFCRLLCSTCEDQASRRWSALCSSQCENGGLAYHVCLRVWQDYEDRNAL